MIVKTKGVVVYKVKYSETSLIVHLYTEDLGLKAFIVKGVRSKKSKISVAMFDYLNVLEVVASQGGNSDLLTLREVSFSEDNSHHAFDPVKNSILLFLAEFIHKTVVSSVTDPMLFRFINNSIHVFKHSQLSMVDFHLWFATKYSMYLGIQPINNYSEKCQIFNVQHSEFSNNSFDSEGVFSLSSSKILNHYLNVSINECVNNKFSLEQRNQFLDEILFYYRYHLEHFKGLKSHEILKSVFR